MCATARQDVRGGPAAGGPAPGVPAPGDRLGPGLGRVCGALTTVLVTGTCSEPSEITDPTREPALACTAPESPAPATASTPIVPAAAAMRPGLTWPSRGRQPAARTRFQVRPIAPWRIGSSTNSHDSAASRMDAVI